MSSLLVKHYQSSFIRFSYFSSFRTKFSQKQRTFSQKQTFTMEDSEITNVRRYEIIKSPEDDRLYRGLVLANGMKAVLVSDPSTDKSAAAMDVNVGFMSDPVNLPGLAHFCEHMLFMGTEKYPDENEYSKYLSHHGGWSNAFTANDHTNYYYTVSAKHLPDALDRFAQFFLCPLFTESATEREVQAVNSEHEKNIPSDAWRINQLEHSLSDPSHDYYKFGTGNIDTLQNEPRKKGIDVRQELLQFHRQWYSANIMGLAVLGSETLDELEAMVMNHFNGVENKNVQVPEYSEHPYRPETAKTMTYVVPVKDFQKLKITFPTPNLEPYYNSGPGHYLAHLIGHEGKGSLLSELKAQGWANSLSGGQSDCSNGFGFFLVSIELTEEGLQHIDDIITLFFQYLEMLRSECGIQEWIFEECKNINAMHFRFQDKEKPASYVSRLAGYLHTYPMEEVLTGSYLMSEWRPDLIQMVLDKLVPDNMYVSVISRKFSDVADREEPWYGTKYRMETIAEEKINAWKSVTLNAKFEIPEKNEFIPTDFEPAPRDVDDTESGPRIVKESSLVRVWFKQDNEFKHPKGCLQFQFKSPLTYIDPHYANVSSLWTQLIKDDLNEYSYSASLAGLHYYLSNTKSGFGLAITGYHEKQATLLEKILQHITNFRPTKERFEVLKERYVRGLKNFKMEQPHQHAIYYNQMYLSSQFWSKDEMLSAVDHLNFESVRDFVDQLMSFGLFIEGLVHGNFTTKSAFNISDILEKSFQRARSLTKSQLVRDREVQIEPESNFFHTASNDVHKSSCIEFFLQCGIDETRHNTLLDLFEQLIHEQCFDVLRTKEQLGYIVHSSVTSPRGIRSLRIIVQSSKVPEYLDERIEKFLFSMRNYIESMPDVEFEKNKSSLAEKLLEKPKKLSARTGKFWSEIVSQQYHFDRDQAEADVLKSISKQEVLEFFDTYISSTGCQRRKIACHVLSTVQNEIGNSDSQNGSAMNGICTSIVNNGLDNFVCPKRVKIADVVDFKAHRCLWQQPKPYNELSSLVRSFDK